MKKIFVLILIFYLGYVFPLKSQSKISQNRSLSINDSVLFNYNAFGSEIRLDPLKLKFYNDTLFVYKMIIYNIEEDVFDYSICEKIVNKDTINIIDDFIRLFIIEKKENIILKESDSLYGVHTMVDIHAYKGKELMYKEKIIMYPEREYNPKFLELCSLFHNIALQITP